MAIGDRVSTEALESFSKKNLKIFVCGDNKQRPTDLMTQPSMQLLQGLDISNTLFVEADKDMSKAIDVTINEPKAGGIIDSQTQSSKDFRDLEETLKGLGNRTWVMDKDSILRTFVEEGSSKQAALSKGFKKFKDMTNNDIPMGPRDEQYIAQELMAPEKNNPFSMAVPSVSFEGNVGLINPADPDMPIHDMFYPYMKEDSVISLDQYNKFINYHEAGHANDRRNHRQNQFEDAMSTAWKRHRTECVADTFATLKMAKETGNIEIGKLATDVRNEFTVQGLAYVQKHLDQQRQQQNPDAVMNISESAARLGDFASKDFEDSDYVGSPELKKYIESQKNPNQMKSIEEPSNFETMSNRFQSPAGKGLKYGQSVEDVLGSILAYTTTPTVDATLKVADEKLKDGSLKKMPIKDVYTLAEKLVDENTFSQERITETINKFVQGEHTPEIKAVMDRRENSGLEKAREQVQATNMTKEQLNKYDAAFANKLEKAGEMNPAKLMDIVEKEKDRLRKISPFKSNYKTAHAKIRHLNKKYIDNAAEFLKGDKTAKITANKEKYKADKTKKTVNPALLKKGKER